MGKFKDEHGHTRWKEAQNDVKRFVENHREEIGEILETVVGVAFPRYAAVLEAIKKVKESSIPREDKLPILHQLKKLKNDLRDDED